MAQTLIKDKRYLGKYVAMKDFEDTTIISSGRTPQEVYEEALHKGCKNPVIVFVPLKGMIQIYLWIF